MRTKRVVPVITLIALLAAAMITGGCASDSSSAASGTGLGAAAGALLGYGLTGSGLGAAAGAGAGALAGAITGTVVDETRKNRQYSDQQYSNQQQYYQPPPPQPTYQQPAQAYQTQSDPTFGEMTNQTRWLLEVTVDDDAEPLFLNPRGMYPLNLDIGTHRILAKAFTDTKFGKRLVGTSSQTIYVDPKGAGWSMRFDENQF